MRHVPQTVAEAEASIGTVMVKSDSIEVLSFEYATIAKSLVVSKPDMRTGWTSSPYCL